MATLPTNFQDDVLDVTQNENRKYNMIQNQDGTVSFEDATVYVQQGSQYGAQNVNAQNTEINALNSNLTLKIAKLTDVQGYVPVDAIAYDETNKKLGLKVNGADTVIPFSGGSMVQSGTVAIVTSGYSGEANVTFPKPFNKTPQVRVSSGTWGCMENINGAPNGAKNITKNGFTCCSAQWTQVYGTTVTAYMNWVAWEVN